MTETPDFHIVLAGDTKRTALRVLIAMEFGCDTVKEEDFENAKAFFDEAHFTVNWAEGLSESRDRMEFLFASDNPVRSGDDAYDGTANVPGATDFDESASENQTFETNRFRPFTVKAIENIEQAHKTVDAELWIAESFIGTHLRAPRVAPSSDSRGRRFLAALNKKMLAVQRGVSRLLFENVPADQQDRTVRIRFHLMDYNSRDTKEGTVAKRLEKIAKASMASAPQDGATNDKDGATNDKDGATNDKDGATNAEALDMGFVVIWPENPEQPLPDGKKPLFEQVEDLIQEFRKADLPLKKPVPFVLATGEMAAAASLIGNVGSDRNTIDLLFSEIEGEPRIHPYTFSDPIAFAYGDVYINEHISMFIDNGGLNTLITAARRQELDFRLVPFDINGVDKDSGTIASIYLPQDPYMGDNDVSPLRSALFSEIAHALHREKTPDLDFWNNVGQAWYPIRTSTILAAVLAPHVPNQTDQDVQRKFWAGPSPQKETA
ncbi:hypothetical protein [Tropicibacter naphthalenivorans]|uniref:Uncharacterized protein n=1 Tax=Tropicibacter naphthalenivorans TaxID=441103 RepID=A0A0P1GJP6_9RHOB|nr:hypothetical protein [Tropicibacter naphthalenivorans]CUH82362.1 hypothetical protein TRN7648_03930 [Tropicibacter naphthalenivorans]SMD05761.1 hypothetical protein SAMN04488093_11344 [Tropicibacter naphthalenivorans]